MLLGAMQRGIAKFSLTIPSLYFLDGYRLPTGGKVLPAVPVRSWGLAPITTDEHDTAGPGVVLCEANVKLTGPMIDANDSMPSAGDSSLLVQSAHSKCAEYSRRYRERHPKRTRANARKHQRTYRQKHPERVRACIRASYWKYHKDRLERAKKQVRLTRNRDPQKEKARMLVRFALRDGLLTRAPCAVCGNTKSQAHHRNYSKPLEVVWLCTKHHGEAHWK